MGIREVQTSAKEVEGALLSIAGIIGVVAGGLGLAALLYEAFKPANPTPVFATAKPGCNTCGSKTYLP